MSRPHEPRTPAQVAEAAAFFDGLTEAEIRRRQGLCEAQLATAHRLRDPDTLARLREMESDLTQAMLRRL